VSELNPDPAGLAVQPKLDNMKKPFAEAIRLAEISNNEME
jgi:hypothetical protein